MCPKVNLPMAELPQDDVVHCYENILRLPNPCVQRQVWLKDDFVDRVVYKTMGSNGKSVIRVETQCKCITLKEKHLSHDLP